MTSDRSLAGERRPTIVELSEVVRNQIAAGEVVERPASVVKELVENALDAGATHIVVDLEEGGVRLVRVSDDGSGLGRADLELAFRPHATSKLRDASDLEHIASLGFRGEALASIGSVARCRIFSRPAGEPTGHAVEVEGGAQGPVLEAGGPEGTRVEIRDLFYNTPARRRFLKTTQTELSRCLDVLQRTALAHPGVAFVATHDGRRAFDVEAGMDLRARVRRTFGADLSDALVEMRAEEGDTLLEGLVAPPRFARRDASRQMWFLNGRPLRDRTLASALKEGYRGFLADGRQPVAFLSLSMDPSRVDVNVHPTKAEVRFRDGRRLFGFLVRSLREAVARTDISTPGERLLETAGRRGDWTGPAQPSFADPGILRPLPRGANLPAHTPVVREVPGLEPPSAVVPAAPVRSITEARDDLRGPFLQIARTYLVRALDDGFEIVDQHALHERVSYEALLAEVRAEQLEVQRLLVAELIEVSRAEAELLEAHFDALARAGFDLTLLGETTVAVHGLPARLADRAVEPLVRTLAEVLEEKGRAPSPEELLEDVLHRAACRGSVMAGDPLSQEAIRALLESASRIGGNAQTCPHGRPTRVRFRLADLEKAFHRR